MMGNRAIYHDGWVAATTPPAPPWLMGLGKLPTDVINGYNWELYNVKEDFSENNDLAAKMPDKLRDMQELFLMQATKYNVLPLDNSVVQRLLAPRPSTTGGRTVFTYSGELAHIPHGGAPSILNKSFTITADLEVPKTGAEGMLVTEGGRFAGYGFYLLKGKPVFTYDMLNLERVKWEAPHALSPGNHTVAFDFKYDGGGIGKGGLGVLKVDGQDVVKRQISHTIPFIFQWDETFDVGVDTGTPVDDNDYQVPFRFTGKLAKLTVQLRPVPMKGADEAVVQEKGERNNSASE